jgi:hypothetical protein
MLNPKEYGNIVYIQFRPVMDRIDYAIIVGHISPANRPYDASIL